jgi:HD-GYP domain-containing protein (c-di-GMP phosphodiesterase class II)
VRRISIDELKPGMILGRSIFSEANNLVLAAGKTLDEKYIKRFRDLGYGSVFIEEKGFESVNPMEAVSVTTRTVAERAVLDGIEKMSNAIRMKTETENISRELLQEQQKVFSLPNANELSLAVAHIVRDVIESNVTLVDVFAELTHDTYIYRHSVNVAVLSVLLGRKFGFTSKQLRELSLGALLHDVGKVCMQTILGRPKRDLEEDEIEEFKEHPVFGALIVKNTNPSLFTEYFTVLHHHEWQNGNGYPQGLTGDNQPPTRSGQRPSEKIFRFAEIVSVTEAFDNLVNGYGELPRALTPADALGTIISLSHKRFNQNVCHAFSQIVCLYPTGSLVQILDCSQPKYNGYFAVVKEQNFDSTRPVVILYADTEGTRVKPITLDFMDDPRLRLRLMG